MGRPKEALPIADTTLLGWQCRTLHGCTDDIVIVRRNPEQQLPELPPGIRLAEDLQPDLGPLAAISAGLRFLRERLGYLPTDAAMVCGCDQPFLTAALVRWLRERLGDADLLMPRASQKLQPLTAIYRVALQTTADRLLAAGRRRPRELVAEVGSARILEEGELRQGDPQLLCLQNLNQPDDYERARRHFESS